MTRHARQLSIAGLGFLFLLLGALEAFRGSGLSSAAHAAMAIALIAALLWVTEAVPLYVTSLLVLFLALVWLQPVTARAGSAVIPQTYLAPFFSNIILLFLGGFVLASGLHKHRLDEQLARCMIRRTGTSVPRLMLAVMGVTAFLSMILSNTATAAMMLSLVLPVLRRLPEGDPGRKGMLLCIPFAANVGGLGTPIGSPPNAIAMQYMRQLDLAPSFLKWMAVGVPGLVVVLLLAWAVLRWMYRGQNELAGEVEEARPPTPIQGRGVVLAGVGLTVMLWMTEAWHGWATGTVALIPVLLFFGTRVLRSEDFRSLPWDVLVLMGGGLCLGAVITTSGLADWAIGRLPAGDLGIYGVTVLFACLACAMSSFMSNTATANLIMPLVMGLNLQPLSPVFLGVAFACSLAMPLPISTPPNAMAFSSGIITVRDIVRPGLMITLAGLALALTLGYAWWHIIFGH